MHVIQKKGLDGLFIGVLLALACIFYPFDNALGQTIAQPKQPITGFGGSNYSFTGANVIDRSQDATGYWLFIPDGKLQSEAQVVVFIHGYGAINPMIYGGWIRHLTRKGHIVIFPRYQEHVLNPPPSEFAGNVVKAIKNSLQTLDSMQISRRSELVYAGHSYGGALTAYFGSEFMKYGLSKPAALLVAEPGTGPFSAGKLEDYGSIPKDIPTIVIVGTKDWTVGESLGTLIFETTNHLENRLFVRQFPDGRGDPSVSAGHYEPYSLLKDFDSGLDNFSTKRALKEAKTDAVDYYCYWKFLDLLLHCVEQAAPDCEVNFQEYEHLEFMGKWTDETAIKPLSVQN